MNTHSKPLPLSLFAVIGSFLVLLLGGVLAFTNPSNKKYETFATEQLSLYAKENLCQATEGNLEQAIKSQVCHMMVETGKGQIPRVIRETTIRKNYFLLSLYDTNLYLYKFRTVGLLNNFYIISADQVYDQK